MGKKKITRSGVEYREPTKNQREKGATRLEALMQNIQGKRGQQVMCRASEAGVLEASWLSTGVFALDACIGGGWPIGYISMAYGLEESGKSTVMKLSVASAQQTCRFCYTKRHRPGYVYMVDTGKDQLPLWEVAPEPKLRKIFAKHPGTTKRSRKAMERKFKKHIPDDVELVKMTDGACRCGRFAPMRCLWIDAECKFNGDWAAKLGVDLDRLWLIREETAEDALDVADAAARTGDIDLIVLDSMASLAPQIEIENSVANQQMGVAAKTANKAFRKWVSTIGSFGVSGEVRPTILLVNQLRSTMNPYGRQEIRPAGRAQRYNTMVAVRLKRDTQSFETVKRDKGVEATVSGRMDFTVKKNQMNASRAEGSFRIWFVPEKEDIAGVEIIHPPGDTGEVNDVFFHGQRLGVFGDMDAPSVGDPEDEDAPGKQWDSLEEMVREFMASEVTREMIRQEVLEALVEERFHAVA